MREILYWISDRAFMAWILAMNLFVPVCLVIVLIHIWSQG